MFFCSEPSSFSVVSCFLRERPGQLQEIVSPVRGAPAVLQVRHEILVVLLKSTSDPLQSRELGSTDGLGGDAGGDVHAVEHVADVVDHAGGDLRLAGHPGHIDELLLGRA